MKYFSGIQFRLYRFGEKGQFSWLGGFIRTVEIKTDAKRRKSIMIKMDSPINVNPTEQINLFINIYDAQFLIKELTKYVHILEEELTQNKSTENSSIENKNG